MTHTGSVASRQVPRSSASLGILAHGSSPSVAGKKTVWDVWDQPPHRVRPTSAPGARSAVRRFPDLSRVRSPASRLPPLSRREAGTARLARRQPTLYPAVRAVCRQAVPLGIDRRSAADLHVDWDAVKEMDKLYMREQLEQAGTLRPGVIDIDEIARRCAGSGCRPLRSSPSDRTALGGHHRVLPAGEQSGARICGGTQQQDSRHPTTLRWTARRGLSASKDPDVHAPTSSPRLKSPDFTHTNAGRP